MNMQKTKSASTEEHHMNTVVGASGQVGSALVKELRKNGVPVTAVIRDKSKSGMFDSDVSVRIADVFNADSLTKAFDGGETVFLMTPESFASDDVLGDGQRMIAAYREAIEKAGIRRVVGLSSMGAHLDADTGNLMISHWLEQAFVELPIETLFIRPAYYYSNWLAYIDVAKDYGVLPTFFAPEQKIPMVSPQDVAWFAASVMAAPTFMDKVVELAGPKDYNVQDVAHIYARSFERDVVPQQTPKEQWVPTLIEAGFSEDAARNMAAMTATLTDGESNPKSNARLIRMETPLDEFSFF